MSAGDSAGEAARAAADKANRLRAQAQRLEQVAEAYEKGERGEQHLERLAEPLAANGCHLLSDRCVPGKESNIDFLLVGPAGVFVIDAKNWSGDLRVDGSVLRQNGRRRQEETERVRSQADVVSGVLMQAGAAENAVPVHSVLAFVGEAGVGGAAVCDGVHVVDGTELVGFVRSFDPTLRTEHVAWAHHALENGLAPRTANREHAGDPGRRRHHPSPSSF